MSAWLWPKQPQRTPRRRWLRLGLGACTLVVVLWLVWGHLHLPAPATAGSGAGGTGRLMPTPGNTPTVDCSPVDVGTCLAETLFSWVATQVQQAIQPVTDAILTNDIDIIYQTPAEDSYQEHTVITINAAFVAVVDAALATLLVVGAYNLMVGEQLSLPHASFGELVARIVLVVGVVHFNLYFLGEFIELENALTLEVDHASGIAQLANLLSGLLTNTGMTLITFVLMIIISFFVLWLLGQMVVRIALVAVCVAVAPLGLACLLLPQTIRWGRLWLTTFASSVMVQLVQVIALSLGGVFITELASTSLVRLDRQLAVAFLAIGMLFLVTKIPGMMQQWALHPMMQFGGKGGGSSQGGTSSTSGGSSTGDGVGGDTSGGGTGSGSGGGSAIGGGGSNGTMVTLWGEAPDAYVFQTMLI